jgi:polyphosphate glucokinase
MFVESMSRCDKKLGSEHESVAARSNRSTRDGKPRAKTTTRSTGRKVLVVDIGGTSIKLLASGETERRSFPSGPTMTPKPMVKQIKALVSDWRYDVVSIGYPGPVARGRPISEPHNLATGWVGFDFAAAFGRPVKIINDAAMQALGSYEGGKMLFLGLGTGLGSAIIVDGIIEPMEVGHLPYKKGTYEDYVGRDELEKRGRKRWQRHVEDVVARLIAALEPDETVLGGGNVKKLDKLPPGCRAGNNANAFLGGFRLWEDPTAHPHVVSSRAASKSAKGKSAKG